MTRAEKKRRCNGENCAAPTEATWTLGGSVCDGCVQTWEPERDGGAAFRAGENYLRADGLERVQRRLDREFDERSERDLLEVQRLDNVLMPAIRSLHARTTGVEFMLASELAMFVWNEARRLGGQAEVQVWPAERPRGGATRYPFGGVGAALAFRAEEHVFGLGSMTIGDGEDSDSEGRPLRKRSKFSTAWELAQRDAARAKYVGRPLPPPPNGTPYGGFLPIEFMPAKQSSSGNLGSCRGIDLVDRAIAIDRAIGGFAKRTKATPDEFGELFDLRVGAPKRHTGRERCWCGGRCFRGSEEFREACRTWVELVPLRAAHIAERTGKSAHSIGRRASELERELQAEMYLRELTRAPRKRDDDESEESAAPEPPLAIPIVGFEAA